MEYSKVYAENLQKILPISQVYRCVFVERTLRPCILSRPVEFLSSLLYSKKFCPG